MTGSYYWPACFQYGYYWVIRLYQSFQFHSAVKLVKARFICDSWSGGITLSRKSCLPSLKFISHWKRMDVNIWNSVFRTDQSPHNSRQGHGPRLQCYDVQLRHDLWRGSPRDSPVNGWLLARGPEGQWLLAKPCFGGHHYCHAWLGWVHMKAMVGFTPLSCRDYFS